MDPAPPTLALVRDLIFATKISSTARALGTPLQLIRDPGQLGTQPGRLLIVDLNLPGAIPAAAEWSRATGGQVVGYVSHVDADTIAAAKSTGLIRVMARSQFTQMLPDILRLGPATPNT